MSKSRLTELLPLNLPLPPELEMWRKALLRTLPSPVTGELTLFSGEPLKVIVAFDQEGAEVLLPMQESAMSSVSRHKPVPQGKILLATGNVEQLQRLVGETIALRIKSFRECACCGRRVPQELLGSLNGAPACRNCLQGRRFLF